jgi:hypothetical protein
MLQPANRTRRQASSTLETVSYGEKKMGHTLADDSERRVEIVGPVEVRFENRSTTVRAAVFPGDAEPLLGVIPMEDMDVLIDSKQQRLIVNPETPYIARKNAKRLRA